MSWNSTAQLWNCSSVWTQSIFLPLAMAWHNLAHWESDHNDTFSSIMEAPLIARLSAIFNFIPAHGRKQTGWKYWCVTAVKDSLFDESRWVVFLSVTVFSKTCFSRQELPNVYICWLGMISRESLLRCRMINLRSMSLFMSTHPATISATLRPDPFHPSFLLSFPPGIILSNFPQITPAIKLKCHP